MRILLLSDTHGYFDPGWEKFAENCDEIWHAGDLGSLDVTDSLSQWKPVRAVYGNIDGALVRAEFPEYLVMDINSVRVLMIHIGGYPGNYAPPALRLIKVHQPALFICGHSHILKVIYDKSHQMLTMNPGAAGISGFHKIRTMLRFSLVDGRITDAEAIELGPRVRPRD